MLKSHSRVVAGAVVCGAVVVAVALVAVLPAAGSPTSPTASPSITESSSQVTPAPSPAKPAALPSKPAATTQTALSSVDIKMVNAEGSALATKAGSVVSVVRGAGTAIWNAVSPDVTTLDTTPEVLAHDFLLVTCTDNVVQAGYRAAPGAKVPVIGAIQMVIDETTGQVLETTRIPKGMTNSFAPADAVAQLGTSTVVALSAASFS